MKLSKRVKAFFVEKKEHVHTMWDAEQIEKKIKKRLEERVRSEQLKKERAGNRGKILIIAGIKPAKLLLSAGYKFRINGGYIKQYESDKRFHAYIIKEDAIQVHSDAIFERPDKSLYHIASEDNVPLEIKRLKEFLPVTIKVDKKGNVKSQTLRHDLMKKALEELKNKKD